MLSKYYYRTCSCITVMIAQQHDQLLYLYISNFFDFYAVIAS